MPASVSLLVVNYRSAALALEAIRSARAAARGPLQVVIVDNSVDPAEAEALRAAGDVDVIAAERNLGYAGAINRGRRVCDGEVIVVANPDVIFAPGAIDALVDANAAVAGPALFWDDAHQWILPPAELHTRRGVLSRALASRSPAFAKARDRRRIRARMAFWSLTETTPVPAVSGAVMAIRARAFDDASGFDERFPLYFEEIDFERRVRGGVVYVPSARVRHVYNQSAGPSPDAGALYAQSEALYLQKWGGGWAKRLEWRTGALACPVMDEDEDRRGRLSSTEFLVEASPLPTFDTAAGHFTTTWPVALPAEVLASYRGTGLYLRAVDRKTAKVLARMSV